MNNSDSSTALSDCPSGKKKHDDKKSARQSILELWRFGAPELYFYECPICGFYHLTKDGGGRSMQ